MIKRASIFLLMCLLCGVYGFSQNLNEYKYIKIPERFGFQKEDNSYKINELTKFLFNKYQFVAFLEREKQSQEVTVCDVLNASMEKKGGFINTKIKITLKDCKGGIVYTSPEGLSIKKDYKKAYHEAIRNTFNNPLIKNHKYLPSKKLKSNRLSSKKDLIAKPRPVTPILGLPEEKKPTKKIIKKPTPQLMFELRGKQYAFQKNENGFLIFGNGNTIGKALLLPNGNEYKVDAGNLSGSGIFDDYGNFILKRVNPVNKKPISDIMARIN